MQMTKILNPGSFFNEPELRSFFYYTYRTTLQIMKLKTVFAGINLEFWIRNAFGS